MTITGAIVVFAILWFLTLFMVLPFGVKSQGEHGEVVPGTPASAPEVPMLRRKFRITTLIATVLWAIAMAVIITGAVSLRDLPLPHLPSESWGPGITGVPA
jgi:predicted secreted protein